MSQTANVPAQSGYNDQRTFDEWMKIAADNKITAANTWNLALIDYFADMTVLRDGDSINFQKASITLDGCVKVYTSRVDSVDVETKILLNGLVDGRGSGTRDEIDSDADAGLDELKRKRQTKTGNTLEKDITVLNIKKFETEFLIDPLFKKTSADFDEGTASGLLLNHLNMANEGMIIFDASDDITVSKQMADHADTNCDTIEIDLVDISRLKGKFMNDITRLRHLSICPSLKSFDFSAQSNEMPKFDFNSLMQADVPAADDYVHNFDDNGSNGGHNDYGGGNFGGSDNDDGDDRQFPEELEDGNIPRVDSAIVNGSEESEEIGDDSATGNRGIAPGNGFGLALEVAEANNEKNPFAYFDSTMVRRWAGPEHWKPKPIIKAKEDAAGVPKKKREPSKIIFLETTVTEKQLFTASTVSIALPKYNEKSRTKNLLPNDEHFSAQDFLKLFLKPVNKVIFRKKGKGSNDRTVLSGCVENAADPAFWSQHQDEHVSFAVDPTLANSDVNQYDGDDFPMMDDEDDGFAGFPSLNADPLDLVTAMPNGNNGETMLEYGDNLVDVPKKVKANYIHFAKTQKKVDIKKLKENLWSNLIDLTGEDSENEDAKGKGKEPAVFRQETTNFKNVVQGLSMKYSTEKMNDISVAFCFICLLHLANEKNLSVVSDVNSNDLKISRN
ncbi:hypothetical protein HK100_007732 [Physocladia obscura]|uniref:Condensin complex subunit 2 n=1 Tax=Physocladia obscura TaxID=109957 RepID=A0AAD5T706_9FUNG|nr:hypothetical protein HK100_007732 [Physocladia obscura]